MSKFQKARDRRAVCARRRQRRIGAGMRAMLRVYGIEKSCRHERRGFLLLSGLFGILIGIGAAFWPGITVLAFVLTVAAQAFISRGLMLSAAFGLKISNGRQVLVVRGIISLLYGQRLYALWPAGAAHDSSDQFASLPHEIQIRAATMQVAAPSASPL